MSRDRHRRRDDGCIPKDILKEPLDPRIRPTEKCGPGETPIPESFILPNGVAPGGIDPRDLPAALVVRSPERTLSCSEIPGAGPEGADILIESATYERQISWLSVTPGLDNSRLLYISTLPQATVDAITDPENPPTVDYLKNNFKLNTDQATDLRTLLIEAGTRVTDLAEAEALQVIDCVWRSVEGTASCPDDPEGHPAETESTTPGTGYENWTASDVNNPVMLTGVWDSPESLAAAQALADAAAEAELECLYTNVNVVRTCSDVNPGAVDPFSTAGTPSFSVTARVFGSFDRASANDLAAAYAESRLNCIFGNEEITITCVSEFPEYTPGTVFAEGATTSYTILANTYFSQVSVSDANRIARQSEIYRLNCYFENAEIINPCEPVAVNFYYPFSTDDVTVPGTYINDSHELLPTGNSVSGDVAAGAFTSPVSQVVVDALAQSYSQTIKSCEYCNPELVAPCPPGSISAVAGLQEGNICSSNAQSTIDLAISAGSEPVGAALPDGAKCLYGNEADTYKCPDCADSSISTAPGRVEANIFVASSTTAANGLRDAYIDAIKICYVSNTEEIFGCPKDEPCTRATEEDFVIPSQSFLVRITEESECDLALATIDTAITALKNSFLSTCLYLNTEQVKDCQDINETFDLVPNGPGAEGEGKTLAMEIVARTCTVANGLAEELALSKLRCIYQNDTPGQADCDPVGAEVKAYIHPGSAKYPSSNPDGSITIDLGEVITFTTIQDANDLAQQQADALKSCLYANTEITMKCSDLKPPKEDTGGAPGSVLEVDVPEDSAFAATASAAEAIAKLIGKGQLNCIYGNDYISGSCNGLDVVRLQDLVDNTIVSSESKTKANETAQLLADAMSVCAGGGGTPLEPDESAICQLELTGTFEFYDDNGDGIRDTYRIRWVVSEGKVEHGPSSTQVSFAGDNGTYTFYRPHFYLTFDLVDGTEEPAPTPNASITQSAYRRGDRFAKISSTRGSIYLGTFKAFDDPAAPLGDILVENALCLGEPYVYGLGSSDEIPFSLSWDADISQVKVSGGKYIQGLVPSNLGATTHDDKLIYMKIDHTAAGVLDSVEIISESAALSDETKLDSTDTFIETHYTFLGEVDTSGSQPVVKQYKSGNATLVHAFTDGRLHLAPIFEGGTPNG